jgi:hypothetical protein
MTTIQIILVALAGAAAVVLLYLIMKHLAEQYRMMQQLERRNAMLRRYLSLLDGYKHSLSCDPNSTKYNDLVKQTEDIINELKKDLDGHE